jgi:hypothetical protein
MLNVMRYRILNTILFFSFVALVTPNVFAKWEGCEDLHWYYPIQLFWYGGIVKSSDALRKASLIHAQCCDCSLPWLSAMKSELKFVGVARSVDFEEVNVGGGETYNRVIAEFENISVIEGDPITTKTFRVESRIGPCNIVFKEGKWYKVIVAYGGIGLYQTNKCLGTEEHETW